MGKRVCYDFELVDGSYVETDESMRQRIGRMFQIDGIRCIQVLDKRLEKLGEIDGTEYRVAPSVTFALCGRVYIALSNSLIYVPELEDVYLGGDGR